MALYHKPKKVVKQEPVKIEKVAKKPTQAVCKCAGCSNYAVVEGMCQKCKTDLSSIGYK